MFLSIFRKTILMKEETNCMSLPRQLVFHGKGIFIFALNEGEHRTALPVINIP